MNKTVAILVIVLAAQVSLAVGLNYLEKTQNDAVSKKLIAIDLKPVDKIVISEKGKTDLVIAKTNSVWTLPDHYNFPASREAVERVLNDFKEWTRGWPVATTADAAPRFKVASDDYAEKVVLSSGANALATIFVGSKAGHDKVHVRLDKENEINSVVLPANEIGTAFVDWIDRGALELDKDGIVAVELPGYTLTKKTKDWEMVSAGKTSVIIAHAAGELLDYVSTINISQVLGTADSPDYGLTTPVFTMTVTMKDGKKVTYSFGRLKGSNFYVVKKPDTDFYLKVDSWFVDRIKDLSAEALAKRSQQVAKIKEMADKASPSNVRVEPSAVK